MEFRFRAKDIAKFERTHKKSILDVIDEMDTSIDTLVSFIRLGYGVDEDKAYDILDNELEKEGMDTFEVLKDIFRSLQRWGFFPKKVNLAIVLKRMDLAFNQVNSALTEEAQTLVEKEQPKEEPKVKMVEEL